MGGVEWSHTTIKKGVRWTTMCGRLSVSRRPDTCTTTGLQRNWSTNKNCCKDSSRRHNRQSGRMCSLDEHDSGSKKEKVCNVCNLISKDSGRERVCMRVDPRSKLSSHDPKEELSPPARSNPLVT